MSENSQALLSELATARQAVQSAQARVAELEALLQIEPPPLTIRADGQANLYTLDHLLEGCQVISFDWRYLYVNEAAARHGSQTRAALLGHTMMEMYPGIEHTALFAALRRCMNERVVEQMENEFIFPDGSKGWFELRIQPVPEGLFILSLDITVRKQMEESSRKSEARYRSVVEDQTDMICRYDHDFNLTFVNGAYSQFYGQPPDALLGTNLLARIPPEDRERAIAHVNALNAARPVATSEHQTLMPDSTVRWVQWTDRALLDDAGRVVEYQGVGRDITDRKILEQEHARHTSAIEEMSRFLQTTLDAFSAITAVLASDGTIINVNAPWRRFADENNAASHYLGANYLDVCDAASGPMSAEAPTAATGIRAVIWGQQDDFYLEYPCPGNGVERWFGLRVTHFAESVPRRVVVAHIDITLRKQAEQALQSALATLEERVMERTAELQEAKDRVEAILNNSLDGILLAHPDLSIRQTNAAFNHLLACDSDDYYGRSLLELIDRSDENLPAILNLDLAHLPGKQFEVRIRRKDATTFDAELSIGHIHGDGLVCTIHDITERKAHEQQLRYHASVQESVSDAVIATDLKFIIRSWNPAAERIYGWRADEAIGKSVTEILRTQYRSDEEQKQVLADFLRQGYWQAEAHQRRQDGTDVYVLASTSFFRDAHGTPIGVVSVNRDITERRLTEQVFQQYAAEVEDLYNHAPVGYHSLNAEGLIVQINDTELDWLGYSRNEVVGKLRFMDFVTPDSRKVFQNNFPIFIERGWVKDLEFDLVRKDGSIFSVLLNATAIKDEHGQFLKSRSTIFDITERKRVETALRESEEKFRLLVEVAPVAIIISDNAGQIILVNNQAEVLFGYNHTELLGQPVETLLPEHLRAAHVHHRASYMAEPRVRQMGIGLELFARRKEGSVFPVEIQLSYIETQAGLMVMSFVLDITERKRAAQALREQRDFLQLIIDNVPDLIMVKDRSGRFQMVNDAAAQVYGVTPAAMIGLADADVNTNETEIAFFLQKDRETLAAGRVSFIPEELILNRYYQTSKIPLMNSAGEYERLLVVASDITERRIAEQALQQALEKERELGELKSRFVSMASHEFRTPLATILALTETLTAYRQKMTDDQIGGRLVKIQIQIEHLKDIMDDVLQLARMQARRVEFNPAVMDLDALCRSVLDEFQSRPDITHRLVYTCDEALRNVRLDKKLMRQIINNLVSNAIKYSSADTTVTIALNYTGEALVLRVSDEGIGIPEADLKHLFEPFHRAANVGTISGTGLGLTIIKESVELHGGIITVESQVSVGTTFTVRIPLTVEEGAV